MMNSKPEGSPNIHRGMKPDGSPTVRKGNLRGGASRPSRGGTGRKKGGCRSCK